MFKKISDKAGDVAGKIADSKPFNALQKVIFFGAPSTNELAERSKYFRAIASECLNDQKTNNTSNSAKESSVLGMSANGK
jgi:hypothetical protein